jgi:hypothetical protein
VISANGLATSSLDLIAPQLTLGLGIGMLVSPLFGFVLASVTDEETGSASGVLNALQQLAGAIGVAVLGTVFFAALAHGQPADALAKRLDDLEKLARGAQSSADNAWMASFHERVGRAPAHGGNQPTAPSRRWESRIAGAKRRKSCWRGIGIRKRRCPRLRSYHRRVRPPAG